MIDEIGRVGKLDDLIAGITPTLIDWTNDPTDAADITDGDITSFCTTGDRLATGAYNRAIFEWDLGALNNVFATGVGAVAASAGTPAASVSFYDGATWITGEASLVYNTGVTAFTMHGATCSKVQLGIYSNAIADLTPNIREFCVWRL